VQVNIAKKQVNVASTVSASFAKKDGERYY